MSDTLYKALTAENIARSLISSAKDDIKLLITAHRNPDGDAVGSAFALKLIYNALGGRALCACCNEVPDHLRFLMRGQDSLLLHENEDYDMLVTVDTASPAQMGELAYLADKAAFAIDHHASCTEYSDSYRDGNASAAGELIYKIYEILVNEKSIKENADICRLIYAAISADTGSFKYSNTTEETHITASKLTRIINSDRNGINTSEISRLLHNCKSLQALKAEKMCIENLKITENGKIAYVVLEIDKMQESGLKEEDFGSSVDIPRCIEGVLLALVIKESEKTQESGKKIYRISTRSSCDISVADICSKFNGGGHAKAAGGSIEAENVEIATDTVLKEFRKALRGES